MSPAAQPEAEEKATKTKKRLKANFAELDGQPVQLTKPKKGKRGNKAALPGTKIARGEASSAQAAPLAAGGKSAKRKKRTQTDGHLHV